MLPEVNTLEELSKIHLDVIKHSGLKWVMIIVHKALEGKIENEKEETELCVVKKPQDLWIITLKIETTLSKLIEVAYKVVLPCTLCPEFILWNMFICNSYLRVWVTSLFF